MHTAAGTQPTHNPRGASQKLLERSTPVNRRPIPDRQQPQSDVPDQVLEELDGVETVEGLLAHQDIVLTGRRDATMTER